MNPTLMKYLTLSLLVLISLTTSAQVVTLDPANAGPDDPVTLLFNAAEGNGELKGADKVYLHHGIVTDAPNSQEWSHVIGNWGADDGVGLMSKVEGEEDLWKIDMTPSIRQYFEATETENIYRISAVFRSADGNTKGTLAPGTYGWGEVAGNGDFFINLNVESYLIINTPQEEVSFIKAGESLEIKASASGIATEIKLFIDSGSGFSEKSRVQGDSVLTYAYKPAASEHVVIKVTASLNGEMLEAISEHDVYVVNESAVAQLPGGMKKGINYHDQDPTKVTLVLEAPGKQFVYVTGGFNDWNLAHPDYQMKRTPDGELFWLELTGLTAGKEYLFQYQVNGETTIGDPYADKIADPWNDPYISSETYPDLLSYDRYAYGPASYLQTNQSAFQWASSETTWERPAVDHLVIYELLVRDFIGSHAYPDLIDTLSYLKKLGVQAIELMPVSEFEGNESWGYNPMYYFAPDKYYGTKDQLKQFIQAAHQMGMAVILDMVLNHAYGLNPMVRMYWNKQTNNVAADNPWFNEDYVGPYDWGYDFNHQSTYTQAFIDSVNTYWLKEYHFDGYRFDFTKGFTQNESNFDGYDQERIDVLKRMADVIWEEDQEAYIILEHWGSSSEEKELSDYGMKLWRNRVHSFYDVMAGNTSSGFSNLDETSHVTFVGSHDEERVAHQGLNNGISSSDGVYNVRDEVIMVERAKLVGAFNLMHPGPKMIWQFDELAYDISIDFNGRVGNKPLPWGTDGLGYYEDPLRRYVYDAYAGILDVRSKIGPGRLAGAQKSHTLNGQIRQLAFDTEGVDVIVIGNFGVAEGQLAAAFSETGDWFDYFSGEVLDVTQPNAMMTLAPGEWHLYTSERLSDGFPGVVEVAQTPVSVAPYPFKKDQEITITFDPAKASAAGTNGLQNASKVYMHAGVILANATTSDLTHVIGNLNDDGVGIMTQVNGKWEVTLTPANYFNVPDGQDIRKIGMYFRDAENVNLGKGFRDQLIYVDVLSSTPIVSIDPPAFTATDEITITFNAAAGNGELLNTSKVYMHASVDLNNTDTPWQTGWQWVVGNWGEDDGVGLMTRSTDNPSLYTITLVPKDYFGIVSSAFPKWVSVVFRSANGSIKGTAPAGVFENGIIHTNSDIFIENKGMYVLEVPPMMEVSLYPNPAVDRIFIRRSSANPVQVRIIDLSGKQYNLGTYQGDTIELSVSDWKSGIYIIQLQSTQGMETIRLLKQ